MNILEIIIIVLTALLAIAGFRKGFVRKLASMLSLVLSIVLVSAFLPYITDFLKEQTPVYGYIVEQCENVVASQAAKLLDEVPDQPEADYEVWSDLNLGRIDQMEIIENLPIPQLLKDMLLNNNNEEGYKSLRVSRFQDYVTSFIASVILNVIAFILAVIIVQLILWLVITALDLLANIPIIRIVNRLAGMALGLLEALFLIWLFFLVLSLLSATDIGMFLMSMVQESECLGELYDSNLVLTVVLRGAVIFS